jgi:hypothetical protein
LAAGANTTLPPLNVTEPWVALPTLVIVSGLPSTSPSFPSSVAGAMISGVSSVAVTESLPAVGASLTAVTVTLTVAVAVPPWPSLAV